MNLGQLDYQMRVSDSERREAVETLSEHFADGRLDQAELDERTARAMSAKTRGDLARLVDDLPRLRGEELSPKVVTPLSASSTERFQVLLIVAAAIAFVVFASPWWGWQWRRPQSLALIVLIASVLLVVRNHRYHHRSGRRPSL